MVDLSNSLKKNSLRKSHRTYGENLEVFKRHIQYIEQNFVFENPTNCTQIISSP